MKRTNVPEFTKYVRVDTVIECYDITDATTQALLEAMPDAYGGEIPGEDDWPEPDAKRDAPYKLSNIWNRLSADVQKDIAKNARFGPVETEAEVNEYLVGNGLIVEPEELS